MGLRITRGMGVALLLGLGGALLTAPGVAAAESTSATLTPPTLTGATYDGDNVIALFWEPSATAGNARFYDILANGQQVEQVDAIVNGGSLRGAAVPRDRTGASPTATFTVVAEGATGSKSLPSNGLVPVNNAPLPKPVMKSAVLSGNQVTFTWEPTANDLRGATRSSPPRADPLHRRSPVVRRVQRAPQGRPVPPVPGIDGDAPPW